MSSKYKISQKYCWYNRNSMIVRMYFINDIPFTFDTLEEGYYYDHEIVEQADDSLGYEPEDLYKSSFYLIDEENSSYVIFNGFRKSRRYAR